MGWGMYGRHPVTGEWSVMDNPYKNPKGFKSVKKAMLCNSEERDMMSYGIPLASTDYWPKSEKMYYRSKTKTFYYVKLWGQTTLRAALNQNSWAFSLNSNDILTVNNPWDSNHSFFNEYSPINISYVRKLGNPYKVWRGIILEKGTKINIRTGKLVKGRRIDNLYDPKSLKRLERDLYNWKKVMFTKAAMFPYIEPNWNRAISYRSILQAVSFQHYSMDFVRRLASLGARSVVRGEDGVAKHVVYFKDFEHGVNQYIKNHKQQFADHYKKLYDKGPNK